MTNGWEYPRHSSNYVGKGNYRPPPTGPGIFLLPFAVHEMIKTIEVHYHFDAGREAEIQGVEENAPVYKIFAPEGSVIIPVGAAREWVLRLPAGTSVHAYIDKWQKDLEKMARRRLPEVTPEGLEWGRRRLAEMRERREREVEQWERQNGQA